MASKGTRGIVISLSGDTGAFLGTLAGGALFAKEAITDPESVDFADAAKVLAFAIGGNIAGTYVGSRLTDTPFLRALGVQVLSNVAGFLGVLTTTAIAGPDAPVASFLGRLVADGAGAYAAGDWLLDG